MDGAQTVITIFSMIIIFFASFYALQSNNKIIIQKDYFDELQSCEYELEQIQPECAPVICSVGAIGIIWSIMGFILFFIGYILYFLTLRERDKVKDLLKDATKRRKG